jgi:hypothetical protein
MGINKGILTALFFVFSISSQAQILTDSTIKEVVINTDTILRIKNIKALLLSFYLLFPPLRLEAFKLKVIKDEKDYKNNEA